MIGNSPLDSTSGKGQNDGKAALKCRLVTNFAYHRRSRRRRSRTNHKLLKNSKRKTILLSSRAQPLCYRPICIEKLPKSKPMKGIEAQWEVLHGEPGDALCRYLKDMPETLLAMATHARAGAERFVMGSIAGFCVRHAAVPLLLYWPPLRN